MLDRAVGRSDNRGGVKVSKKQKDFMNESFLPKTNKTIVRIISGQKS
jgi:hypothetical protein